MTSAIGTNTVRRVFSGFTFIELIFVALILMILSGTLLPRFRSGFGGLQREQAAYRLAQFLRLARAQAVGRGEPVDCVQEERDFHLEVVREDGSTEPLEGRFSRERLPAAVQVTPVDAETSGPIRFFPDGTSGASDGRRRPAALRVTDQDRGGLELRVDDMTGGVTMHPLAPDAS